VITHHLKRYNDTGSLSNDSSIIQTRELSLIEDISGIGE